MKNKSPCTINNYLQSHQKSLVKREFKYNSNKLDIINIFLNHLILKEKFKMVFIWKRSFETDGLWSLPQNPSGCVTTW